MSERLPLNKPLGRYADLPPDAKAVMRFFFLALVPRPTGLSDDDHIKACAELTDAGLLWFAQEPGSYKFRRCVAGLRDVAPWVDCSAAFEDAHA